MAFQRFSKWKSLIWQTLPHSVFCWRWSAWPSSCPELIVCVQACGFVLKPVLQDSVTSKRRCLCLSLTHRRDAPAPLRLTQESATVQPDKSWTLASCTWTHTVTQLPLCICVCDLSNIWTTASLQYWSFTRQYLTPWLDAEEDWLLCISARFHPDKLESLHLIMFSNWTPKSCSVWAASAKPVLLSLFQSVTDSASLYAELASHYDGLFSLSF